MQKLEDALKNLPKLLREREEELKEKEREVQRLRATLEEAHPNPGKSSDVLRLNIGGERIDVLRRTLTQVEGSMLESKFSGRWDDSLEKDVDGNFFIDQPARLFVPMIDYLRSKRTETPLSTITSPPTFEGGKDLHDFQRMVEYYGISLAIYPIALYRLKADATWTLLGDGMDKIESENWATYCLQPYEGCHSRYVASYEVTFEKCASAQIGWIQARPTSLMEYTLQEQGRGVGYAPISMSLDSVKSAIVVNGESSALLSGDILVEKGTIIRSEYEGSDWYVDGTLVASTAEDGNVLTVKVPDRGYNNSKWIPCFSVKGTCIVSKIELQK